MTTLRRDIVPILLEPYPDYQRLYATSATFKTVLDQYVEMLMIFVVGLAQHAEDEDRRIAEIMRRVSGLPT